MSHRTPLSPYGYRSILGALALVALPHIAAAQTTANFDNLPDPGAGFAYVPDGYAGYNWSGVPNAGGSALAYSAPGGGVCRSAPYCAYNPNALAFGISTTSPMAAPFTFQGYFSSGYVRGYPYAADSVVVQGFIGSSLTPAFTTFFTLPSNGAYVLESFTSVPVNGLLFRPFTHQGGLGPGYIRLDDVTFNPSAGPPMATPEPGTWALLSVGLTTLVVGARARRRA